MTNTTVHTPGQPYELTRQQFLRFSGLERRYRIHLAAIRAEAEEQGYTSQHAEKSAFWAAIAALEAARLFENGQICASDLAMDTTSTTMRWRYWSTSKTLFEAVEYRDCSGGDLPPPRFTVTIPVDRDKPGRYHHDQLAAGGTYCD